jgi:hypothetical protein
MDSESDFERVKWLLASGALLILTGFLCYEEPIYLLTGRTTQATVVGVY